LQVRKGFLQFRHALDPRHLWKLDVHEDDVWWALGHDPKRIFGRTQGTQALQIRCGAKDSHELFTKSSVVFDDHNGFRHVPSVTSARARAQAQVRPKLQLIFYHGS
jgi:hypothetical protein